ncbi:major facilitator superfamily [Fulvivirga imtechensis AK7]|uniref:Major facilitator superfamily n=1 Tax=Fulvivirga imtechensis AK7 TaxID=1237149 RepID=L8JTK3_9BACT|nr:major facilitator superfamily [Fulvivirga imtechensis AK7]
MFALPIGSLLSVPVSGYWVAKAGSRTVVVFSAFLYPLVLLAIGFSAGVWSLIAALFLFGMLGNMLNISINTQAVGVEAAYERNIMATFHGMWSLAGFAGAGIGAVMIAASIPPGTHYLMIAGAVAIVLAFTVKYLLPEDVNTDKDKPIFSLPDRSLVVLGIIAFCSMMCEGAMFDWSGVYFNKVIAVKQDWIGIGYTVFMISMAGTRFVADKLVYRFGLKKILVGSGLFTATGFFLSVLLPHFETSLLGFFIIGIGVSSVVPLVFSAAGRSKIQSPGIALASVSTLGFFGFLIGPPVIGLVAGATDLRLSFALLGAMGLAVATLSSKGSV